MLLVFVLQLLFIVGLAHGQLVWSRLSPTNVGPSPRADMALGYDEGGDILLVFGGFDDTGLLDDTYSYNFGTNTWTAYTPANKPEKRFSMVSGVHSSGFIIAMGEGEGKVFYNDVWRFTFNDVTPNWTKLTPVSSKLPSPRYGAAGGLFSPSSSLFVSHGFSDRRYSDSWAFDVTALRWTKAESSVNEYDPLRPHARCLVGSAMVGSSSVVMHGGCASGGKTGGLCPNQETWWYRDGSWEQMRSCATPRLHSAMAYYGNSEAVLYGGQEDVKQILAVEKSSSHEIAVVRYSAGVISLRKVAGIAPPKLYRHGMIYRSSSGNEGAILFGGISLGNESLFNDIWLLTGDYTQSSEISTCANFFSTPMIHGILMFIACGVFWQIGGIVARYFRHRVGWWVRVHRVMMIAGILFSLGGLVAAIVSVQSDHFSFAHAIIGIIVLGLAFLQPFIAAILKRMQSSLARKIWKFIHIFVGRVTLLLALVNISLGLFLIGAPVAAYATWFVLVFLLFLLYGYLEYRMRTKGSSPPQLEEEHGASSDTKL